ncbi:hypothetical protein GCM10027184_16490 [Saccharothrix stipae]
MFTLSRRKTVVAAVALALAVIIPAGDLTANPPAVAAPAGTPVPTGTPAPDEPGTDREPARLNAGGPDQHSPSREEAIEHLLRQAPKGDDLYHLHRDRKYKVSTHPSEYDEQSGTFQALADDVGYEECEENTEVEKFWFKNRFNLCMTQEVEVAHFQLPNPVPVGHSFFEATVIATAVPGTQDTRFGIRLRHLRDVGTTVPSVMGITLDCFNADPSRTSTCAAEADEPALAVGYPFAAWQGALSGLPFGFTTRTTTTAVPGTDKYAAELRGYFSYLFHIRIASQGLPPNSTALRHEFWRCDSALYVYNTNGRCVFHHAISSIQMSATSATMGKSASFIRDAQNGGPNVAPIISGKKVPGRFGESELHRLYKAYDTNKKIPASRRKIKRTCRDYFSSNYTRGPGGMKMECDEYPFATTYENAALVDPQSVWNYAVRPVPRTDNGAAGNYYGEWLSRDRLLDGDPFYVIITP